MESSEIEEAFESPLYLVDAASTSLSRFGGLLEEAYHSLQLQFVRDDNAVPGVTVHRFSIEGRPPIILRKAAYDVVNDARHALDQATFAASRLLGTRPSKTKTYFPFASNPHDFDSVAVPNRAAHVPSEIVEIIRGMQPWWSDPETKSGNDLLRMLGKLSGPNKHQVPITFGHEMVGATMSSWATGLVIACFAPPARLDRLGREDLPFSLPAIRNRTDYILGVTPKSEKILHDGNYRFVFVASHAERLGVISIDRLLAGFVAEAKRAVDRIHRFFL